MLAKTAYIKGNKQDIKIKISVLISAYQTLMLLKNLFWRFSSSLSHFYCAFPDQLNKLEMVTDQQEDEISKLRDQLDDAEDKMKGMQTSLDCGYL